MGRRKCALSLRGQRSGLGARLYRDVESATVIDGMRVVFEIPCCYNTSLALFDTERSAVSPHLSNEQGLERNE